MKRIFILMLFIFSIGCVSSNKLYKDGWFGDKWCLNNCTDENLKALARQRIEEDRIKMMPPEERFNEEMKKHQGKSKREMILLLGAPSKVQNIEGLEIITYLEYKNSRSTYTPEGGFLNERKANVETEYNFTRIDLIFDNDKLVRWSLVDKS